MKLIVTFFATIVVTLALFACTNPASASDGGTKREITGWKGLKIPFVVVDAGLDAGPVAVDAGEDRRLEFRTRMDVLAMDVGIRAGETVVPEILFAVDSTPKSDAAVVLMRFERSKETTALFFYYDSVKGWQSFPADFR